MASHDFNQNLICRKCGLKSEFSYSQKNCLELVVKALRTKPNGDNDE